MNISATLYLEDSALYNVGIIVIFLVVYVTTVPERNPYEVFGNLLQTVDC